MTIVLIHSILPLLLLPKFTSMNWHKPRLPDAPDAPDAPPINSNK